MKLGVYVIDRGQSPTLMRQLDSDEQDHYLIGRPFEDHRPDIALHHRRVSKRHAIILYDSAGFWTVTDLSANGSQLVRDGHYQMMTKGKAIAICEDDCLEVCGRDFSLVFKTNLDKTVTGEVEQATVDDDDDSDGSGDRVLGIVKIAQEVFNSASKLERFLMLVSLVAIAVAGLAYFL
jgi:pSer/pThr/pTyr-binding forkhead associated (FHA) protein